MPPKKTLEKKRKQQPQSHNALFNETFLNERYCLDIFRHGRQKHWRGPLNFQDSLDGLTPVLRQKFGKNILNFRCKLLNIHDINLYRGVGRNLLSRPILLIMSSIWKLRHETIVELFQMGTNLGEKDQQFLIQKAVDYIHRNDSDFTLNVLSKIEKESIEEDQRVMSALQCSLDEAEEKGLKKGREEGLRGLKEGREETALRMIQNGFEVEAICLCTRLTAKEVEELRKKAKNTKS